MDAFAYLLSLHVAVRARTVKLRMHSIVCSCGVPDCNSSTASGCVPFLIAVASRPVGAVVWKNSVVDVSVDDIVCLEKCMGSYSNH